MKTMLQQLDGVIWGDYARKSSDSSDKQVSSIPDQQTDLKRFCQENEVFPKFSDEDAKTASKPGVRPGFNKMSQRIETGEQTGILCYSENRIVRNDLEGGKILHWLRTGQLKAIATTSGNVYTPESDLTMLRIHFGMATDFSVKLKRDVMRGMNSKALRGHYPGSVKPGYKIVERNKEKVWEIDVEAIKPIIKAFELYLNGNNLREVSEKLFKHGWISNGKAYSKGMLHRILRDPFYCGDFSWMGTLYSGEQEAIISKEQWDHVQNLLSGKYHARFNRQSYDFGKGLVSCGDCNRSMVGEKHKGFVYYRCHGCTGSPYLREEEITKKVLSDLKKFQYRGPKVLAALEKHIKETKRANYLFNKEATQNIEKQIATIKTKRLKLFEDNQLGKIDEGFYEDTFSLYTQQIKDLEDATKRENRREDKSFEVAHSILELASKSADLFQNRFGTEQRNKFLKLVTERVTRTHETVEIEYKPTFKQFLVSQTGRYSNSYVQSYLASVNSIPEPSKVLQEISYFNQI